MSVHSRNEDGELGVPIDRGLDCRLVHGEINVAWAISLEQYLPELRAGVPVALKVVNISHWDAASQVAVNVLEVFGLLAVDIARQVEVELVLLDLLDGDHARILGDFEAFIEDIDDLVDVLRSQAILGADRKSTRLNSSHLGISYAV